MNFNLPAGNVIRALAETMRTRDALYYIMTGELLDGCSSMLAECDAMENIGGGVPALADLARERGIELDPQGCYSVCDMCASLRRRLAGR